MILTRGFGFATTVIDTGQLDNGILYIGNTLVKINQLTNVFKESRNYEFAESRKFEYKERRLREFKVGC